MKTRKFIITFSIIGMISVVLIISGFLAQKSFGESNMIKEKSAQFLNLVQNNRFDEARVVLDLMNKQWKKEEKNTISSEDLAALSYKFDEISEELFRDNVDGTTLAKINGLKLFKNELADKIRQEIVRGINLYLDKSIDYNDVIRFYKNIKILGIHMEKLKKFQEFASGFNKIRNALTDENAPVKAEEYFNIMNAYKKAVLEDDWGNQSAEKSMNKFSRDVRSTLEDRVEKLKTAYRYEEACNILSAMTRYYPGDGSISQKLSEYEKEKDNLVVYDGPIQHIFFHPLIAYPERAFDKDSMSKGYNDWFVTVKEFKKILESLYDRGFILVDIHSVIEEKDENGNKGMVKKEMRLPRDKKPLIISIDDMNYYKYMIENGNVFKLILDSNGKVVTYSVSPQGEEIIMDDNEIVPVLDKFVREHPDFSMNGAKGIIALTGYEGVLGYRTDDIKSPDYEKEKNEALKVIKRLKETGWSFASHSYGHPDIKKISLSSLMRDTTKWKNEVESLTGPTVVYIYPFGSSVPADDVKFKYLTDSGFKIFCAVGGSEYMRITPGYVLMDRRHMDGIAFHYQSSMLSDLFDVKEVVDNVRPLEY